MQPHYESVFCSLFGFKGFIIVNNTAEVLSWQWSFFGKEELVLNCSSHFNLEEVVVSSPPLMNTIRIKWVLSLTLLLGNVASQGGVLTTTTTVE